MTLNEQYLAGTILLEDSVIWGLDGLVTADDFQSEHCRAIFEAAKALKDEGSTIDPAAIVGRARQNGVELQLKFVTELMDITPTTANFAEYARRVSDDARTRRIKELAQEIQDDLTSSPDQLLDKMQQLAAEQEKKRTSKPIYQSISAKDLQKADLPSVKYLILKILPAGSGIVSAPSKIGKSWMVLDAGLSIAAGKPFLGHETNQCGVLYLALEDSLTRLQDRMNLVLQGGTAPDDFHFMTQVPKLDNGLLEMLDRFLKEHTGIELVIVDTLQKIRGQALPRESAYAQDYREMETLKAFFDERGVTVHFVHHNRKMKDDDDPFNMISGTTGLMGAVDTVWAITKKRADQEATLHITGRDVEQSSTLITFDKDEWKWKAIGAADIIDERRAKLAYERDPIVKTIRELLKQSKNGEWKGTAKELLSEGKRICKQPIATSSQKLGYALRDLDIPLMEYDGIVHQKSSNGNAGNKHLFFFQNWTEDAEAQEEMLPL